MIPKQEFRNPKFVPLKQRAENLEKYAWEKAEERKKELEERKEEREEKKGSAKTTAQAQVKQTNAKMQSGNLVFGYGSILGGSMLESQMITSQLEDAPPPLF